MGFKILFLDNVVKHYSLRGWGMQELTPLQKELLEASKVAVYKLSGCESKEHQELVADLKTAIENAQNSGRSWGHEQREYAEEAIED